MAFCRKIFNISSLHDLFLLRTSGKTLQCAQMMTSQEATLGERLYQEVASVAASCSRHQP